MGAWYACGAALRRLLCAGTWLSLLIDLLVGAGAAAIFCLALYTASYGRFRLYALLAALAGFSLFALGAYPPARRAALSIMGAFRRILVTIGRFRWIKVIFK